MIFLYFLVERVRILFYMLILIYFIFIKILWGFSVFLLGKVFEFCGERGVNFNYWILYGFG